MLTKAINVGSWNAVAKGLAQFAQKVPAFSLKGLAAALGAVGLWRLTAEDKAEINDIAESMREEAQPNGPMSEQMKVANVVVENSQSPEGEERSLIDRLIRDPDGSIDWTFVAKGAGAATFAALLYYMLSKGKLTKRIGDTLATALRMFGFADLADQVDSWGEEEQVDGPSSLIESSTPAYPKNVHSLENDLGLLKRLFGGTDEQNLYMFSRLNSLNIKELEKYATLKRSIASAQR